MKKILIVAAAFLIGAFFLSEPPTRAENQSKAVSTDSFKEATFDRLIEAARKNGTVHVIVGLQTAFVPEGRLSAGDSQTQRLEIKQAQNYFLSRFQSSAVRREKLFEYIPFMAFETDAAALEEMRYDASVVSIQEDEIADAALAQSIPIVSADTAWASGFTGSGQTIAIVDSGVDKNHAFLSGRVISEACFSSTNASSTSVCPGGVSESTAAGSGIHCATATDGCAHGTHVAGIAAGKSPTVSGVAKDANIIAIQMFSQFTNCGSGPSPCARYWTSDLIRALERVRTLAATMPNIAAVNLSLQTGQQFASNCDVAHSATKAAIDNLRSVGIATIVCAGNFSFTNALTAPACISTAISVGSTDDGSSGTTADTVSNFSDSSPLLHLLAPGRWISSSVPGGGFQNYSGTSMATPHVAGAFAILKQKRPNASVDRILNALVISGQPITDTRNGLVKPRIRIGNALALIDDKAPYDFDGDGRTDVAVWRASSGSWWYLQSSNLTGHGHSFGLPDDIITPGDYTGDGKTDVAIWRPSTGEWFVRRSEDGSYFAYSFGLPGDIPAPADYDGDGITDTATFRPSTATWYIFQSRTGSFGIVTFGLDGDKPVPADFDGDGKADIAVWRPSNGTWWIVNSSNLEQRGYGFGLGTDRPVPGDYTGDGKADIAVWRPLTSEWYFLRSEDGSYYAYPSGLPGDTPAPGDYDGDGRFDSAVFRPSTVTWYIDGSTAGSMIATFGLGGDRPVANAFVR